MLFFNNSLLGIIFLIAGFILKLMPPTNVNGAYGYRTPFSMKNNETWKEANRFSAIMMIISGILSIIIAVIATVLLDINIAGKVSMLFSFILSLIFTFYTEVHLRKVFDKDGNFKKQIN